jgi:hypothetical protein
VLSAVLIHGDLPHGRRLRSDLDAGYIGIDAVVGARLRCFALFLGPPPGGLLLAPFDESFLALTFRRSWS